MKRGSLLAAAMVATVVAPPACWSAALTPSDVAQHLDVLSFPNSIRPRGKPDARTFAQHGFTQVVPTEGDMSSVDVRDAGQAWLFRITLLGSGGGHATVAASRNGEAGRGECRRAAGSVRESRART